MSKVRVLVVPVVETPYVTEIDGGLDDWRALLDGGWLEPVGGVSSLHGRWEAYCDEEGKIKGLPVNAAATVLARIHGWNVPDWLVGPVVFHGGPTPDGEETRDCPQWLIDAVGHVVGADL